MITAPNTEMTSVAQGSDTTEVAAGYRMPAEWEPHAATWLSWPHNAETWPGCLEAIEAPMVEVVVALAEVETVHINVLDSTQQAHVERLLGSRVPQGRVHTHLVPTNDAWCRDHGAIFVTAPAGAEHAVIGLDFEYNAWGGKYPPYDLDQAAAGRMCAILGVPRVAHSMILEGGAIEVNGHGLLLTTEQCLLNPNRNPAMDRTAIETRLMRSFGIDSIIWLGHGIEGDDTDGHIDELTRFVGERTVVTCMESNRDDPNHEALLENRRRLEQYRFTDGAVLEIVDLPMPEPLHYRGERLPASYANFYVANELVLVPAFGVPTDALAHGVLAGCFPDRRVVPIDCARLVVGLGGLHCLTQQVPLGLS